MDVWVHLSIGSLTVETGADMTHYAPDLVDDLWKQARKGFGEILDAATARGLVQLDTDDTADDTE